MSTEAVTNEGIASVNQSDRILLNGYVVMNANSGITMCVKE